MPDQFRWGAVDAQPTDDATVERALLSFIERFVEAARRERARLKLLAAADRGKALRDLWGWLDNSETSKLAGNNGFPQHLEERFGELRGIYVEGLDACRCRIAESALLSAEHRVDGLFLAESGRIALLFSEVGPPTLCLE